MEVLLAPLFSYPGPVPALPITSLGLGKPSRGQGNRLQRRGEIHISMVLSPMATTTIPLDHQCSNPHEIKCLDLGFRKRMTLLCVGTPLVVFVELGLERGRSG